MDYKKKNKDAIRAIKQALRQLATNGIPVGNMIAAIKDIEEKYAESEDERIRKAIINIFATHKDYEIFYGVSVKDIIAWLEKQGEQKPAWKPSDEQINALYDVLNPCDGIDKEVLGSLYNDIKKLMEE